jgi:hypothetical protein
VLIILDFVRIGTDWLNDVRIYLFLVMLESLV